LSGNAKDICQAQAKAERVRMEAPAEADYKNTPKARESAQESIAKADYNVAKEKCDAQKGKEERACEKEAKAEYDKAKADIKKALELLNKHLTYRTYLVGERISLADIVIYYTLDMFKSMNPDCLTATPALAGLVTRVAAEPRIAAWLAARPVTAF